MSKVMRLPARLLSRRPDSHKGNFGHIFILAGSLKYSGAALLCSESSMRSGAGLVTLGMPKGICEAIIKLKLKEVMILPLPENSDGTLSLKGYKEIQDFIKRADAFVVGPGLGANRNTYALARRIIALVDKPIVIDADGLNALAGYLDILLKNDNRKLTTILTPHPGEMSRLLGVSVEYVQNNRKEVAKRLACRYNCVVVLKGHRSIVACPQGDLYINKTGNPGMSTAGSGDVLTGVIAAFLGVGLKAFDAAKYAVYLHGLAGDLAAKEKTEISLIASDIIGKIPEAIKQSC